MTANVSACEIITGNIVGAGIGTGVGVLAGCVVGGPLAGVVYGTASSLITAIANLAEWHFDTKLTEIANIVIRMLTPFGVAWLAFSLMGIPITFGATVLLGITNILGLMALSKFLDALVTQDRRPAAGSN